MGISAKTLITQAAQKIGVLGRGQKLAGDEAMDWLRGMKQMLDAWSLEQLMIPFLTRETFSLDAQQAFTIGPGGDFDTERPISIMEMEIIDAAGDTYRVHQCPLNVWTRVQEPVSARPMRFFVEDGYPLATIRFDRIPYDPTVRMWSQKPITVWRIEDLDVIGNPDFAGQTEPTSALTTETLMADIEFDRGYESCIVFNLAVYMAADYDKMPSALVLGMAQQLKDRIKAQNIKVPQLEIEPGLAPAHSYYDIIEGPG